MHTRSAEDSMSQPDARWSFPLKCWPLVNCQPDASTVEFIYTLQAFHNTQVHNNSVQNATFTVFDAYKAT